MRKNTPDRIVRTPIFYTFASISWAFGSQWCSQERKNPGIIRMSGFLCYLKAAILHTAAMLAHGIAGRSNPMGSVRHTNHQKKKPSGWMVSFLVTRTGILRRLRRLRVASAFVLTAGQNQRHCIPLPCLRMELPGDRTQWVRSDIRITKKETIRMDGFFFGDPYGNRTHITAVKGRCLNLLTNGPGSGNLTRTDDTPGMNRMLYQLSYAAIFTCAASHGHDVL